MRYSRKASSTSELDDASFTIEGSNCGTTKKWPSHPISKVPPNHSLIDTTQISSKPFPMKAKNLLIMLIATAGLAVAQTDAKNKIADQISELIETQDAAAKKFMDEVRALPREKQREAYQKGYPKFDDTIEALYTLVEESPAEAASLKAISWISSHSQGQRIKGPKFLPALEKHHLDHSELSEVILSLYGAKGENTQAFLSTVVEKSKAQDARGSALYMQASPD
jgi:hypothetical protein